MVLFSRGKSLSTNIGIEKMNISTPIILSPIAIFFVLFAYASETLAGCSTTNGQSVCVNKIELLYLREDGHVDIRTENLISELKYITVRNVFPADAYFILKVIQTDSKKSIQHCYRRPWRIRQCRSPSSATVRESAKCRASFSS